MMRRWSLGGHILLRRQRERGATYAYCEFVVFKDIVIHVYIHETLLLMQVVILFHSAPKYITNFIFT